MTQSNDIAREDGEVETVGHDTRQARSAARLAAVQALYQMELASRGAEAVIREFLDHRFGHEIADGLALEADSEFFAALVRGAVAEQRNIDPLIQAHLAANWKLSRLDSILRALFRVASFELLKRPDVPVRAVINEYVDVAHAFFSGEEPAFVNGALDAIARDARRAEMGGA